MNRFAVILACSGLLVVAGCSIRPLPSTIEGCHTEYALAEDLDVAELSKAGTNAVEQVRAKVGRGISFGRNLSRYESCLQQFDGDYRSTGGPAGVSRTVQSGSSGIYDLPSGYPLLPGDVELWFTLTSEQQQRALSFLESGSTIRASLMED